MTKKKPDPDEHPKKKANASPIHSSAAEHLTLVAAGGSSEGSIEMLLLGRLHLANAEDGGGAIPRLHPRHQPAPQEHLQR
ncbi:hypothetical protein QEH53_19200 [Pelagicoccus sp. SDUM812002]|nr:hypothetical protein [Pelagicoccus sp. SDUM812002]MDQ8187726.1 hypothetical protein [Pelagicoccus sp. SDUM812002]